MTPTSNNSNKHKIISINPKDTLMAIKTIWTANYHLLKAPGMAFLMYTSRISLLVYAAMIIYFVYFVAFSTN